MKLTLVAAGIAVAAGFAPPMSLATHSMTMAPVSVRMDEKVEKKAKKEKPPPKPRLPGEGDPFSAEAKAYMATYAPESPSPRTIADASVIDRFQSYIEESDEPWHATCTTTTMVGPDTLVATVPKAVIETEEANPVKPGGDKPGWTDKRSLAKTHDNSV